MLCALERGMLLTCSWIAYKGTRYIMGAGIKLATELSDANLSHVS